MKKDIISLDTTFDYEAAYKRNYCTLLNIKIFNVTIKHSFKIDGIDKSFENTEILFHAFYREWRDKQWYELKLSDSADSMFWSTLRKANDWVRDHLAEFGFEPLSKDEAYRVADLKLEGEVEV